VDGKKANSNQGNGLFSKRSSGLAALFLEETSRLKRIISGLGLRAFDAEDILQQLYIKAVERPVEFQNDSNALQWLIKVTVNLCLAEHRRKKRFAKKALEILEEQKEDFSKATDEIIINKEELEIIRQALQQMDDNFLTVLIMRYFCDLDSQQISEILSLNPSTVRSRLRIARITLAKRLIDKGIEP
jgi:RNA polymerase sigma-70 factor (ECF subfamily)